MLIGLISDTHGLLRPEVAEALRGADMIVHAGDVGNAGVLERLESIARTVAVRGNVDHGSWANTLPETTLVEVGGVRLHVLHQLPELAIDPVARGINAVIFGHSHKLLIETRDGVLYLNPGSAGPKRFNLPVTVAHLRIRDGALEPQIVELAT